MHGLYLLWWVQEKQISPAIVAAMLAAGDLAAVALELPTGWFADRVGHRRSLVLGSLAQVAGMLWCWLGEGVHGLAIASVLVALGDAFRSGADQALLYRTCVALEREEAFQRIEARSTAVELAVLVGLVVGGGLIVSTWGFAAGWAAEAALSAAGLAIACAMTEPPPTDARPSPTVTTSSLPLSWPLAAVVLPTAFVGAAASVTSFLAQTGGGGTPAGMTVLVAALTLAEAAGSALAARVPPVSGRGQALLAVIGPMLLAAGALHPVALPAAALVLALLLGAAVPLRAAAIQRLAGDHVRARAASLARACDMGVSTILLPIAGVWRTR